MKYLILSALLPQILCQYVADLSMKPDVTFGEHNDRFDLSSFVQRQNRNFDRHNYNEDDDEGYRRVGDGRRVQILHRNGELEEFGYHDTSSGTPGSRADYEENLKNFLSMNSRRAQRLVKRLHEDVKTWRRSNSDLPDPDEKTELPPDPEKEILMHYAVPIKMTVEGYLKAPLE